MAVDIYEELREANEEALTSDGFEEAYIGVANRFGMPSVAAYDYDKCIKILMERDGMSFDEAREFFEFNTIGAWVGDSTPLYVTLSPNITITKGDNDKPSKEGSPKKSPRRHARRRGRKQLQSH